MALLFLLTWEPAMSCLSDSVLIQLGQVPSAEVEIKGNGRIQLAAQSSLSQKNSGHKLDQSEMISPQLCSLRGG